MTESTIAENLPGETGPLEGNRLSIAHLLLWTATTALALSFFEPQQPLEPVIAGYMNAQENAARKDREQRAWRRWRNQYVAGAAFAPVYGLALAGLVLAGWRTANAKLGFPNQPGHWLLVVIGSATALVAVKMQLPLPSQASELEDSLYILIVVGMSLLAGINVGQNSWRRPLFIFAGSLVWISPMLVSVINRGVFVGIALSGFVATLVLALYCAAIDLADRRRWDIFHWLGVATLFGVIGHFTTMFIVTRQ